MRRLLTFGVTGLLAVAGLVVANPGPASAVDLVKSGIGVFRPSEHRFYLDKNHAGTPQADVSFGQSGDLPLSGTFGVVGWDGIGVYRPSNRTFYLDYGYDGSTNKQVTFGADGDLPIVGDWEYVPGGSNDNLDSVGVFRPSSGQFFFDYNNDGVANRSFSYGQAGDIPVAGKFGSPGARSGIGVFRPSEGRWYLDTNLDGVTEKWIYFGRPGDRPVVGDWDGHGGDELGVFRPSEHRIYLDYDLTGGNAEYDYSFGTSEDRPIAGYWFN
ncbi:hypothetical protein [Actinoplanes sp. NPDC089786]|uniref:hypothetical protein n=1 Tax=Actinoplanes sp. NPDC089786 TaxID=3155185 RepID=UPI00341CBCFE